MRAGELRHRLTLQENQPTRGPANEEVEHWVTLATLWGSVSPVSAREYITQARDQVEITHKVRIRYRAGFKTRAMRFLLDGRALVIQSPPLDTNEVHRELVLLCRETP